MTARTTTKNNSIAVATVSGVPIEIFPLSVSDGVLIDEKQLTGCILISGADCFHPDVAIRTTMKIINETMEMMTKDEAKIIFPSVWNAIKNVNTDTLYRRGGKAWSNFMDDIVLYYVARFKLFGSPMPIIEA
jgi:hypothetical protein